MSETALKQTWIVIPTYNERGSVRQLLAQLTSLPINSLHILIVDDNSPDGTIKQVRQATADLGVRAVVHYIQNEVRLGFAQSYCVGFAYAIAQGAENIVHLDADLSHNPTVIPDLLKALTKADMVIGSRYMHGISIINWPLHRLFLSLCANWYIRHLAGLPYRDTTSGFRAWRVSAIRAVAPDTLGIDGYGFLIGMLYRAHQLRHTIVEVPIIFTERRTGQSKMSKRMMLESLLLVLRLRFGAIGRPPRQP